MNAKNTSVFSPLVHVYLVANKLKKKFQWLFFLNRLATFGTTFLKNQGIVPGISYFDPRCINEKLTICIK